MVEIDVLEKVFEFAQNLNIEEIEVDTFLFTAKSEFEMSVLLAIDTLLAKSIYNYVYTQKNQIKLTF